MATKEKKTYIGALVPVSLAEKLKASAKKDQRTVTGQLIVLLTKVLPKE